MRIKDVLGQHVPEDSLVSNEVLHLIFTFPKMTKEIIEQIIDDHVHENMDESIQSENKKLGCHHGRRKYGGFCELITLIYSVIWRSM